MVESDKTPGKPMRKVLFSAVVVLFLMFDPWYILSYYYGPLIFKGGDKWNQIN